ncbi:MAG: GNAT family N-acetyltransferase [bacterium]|nr:GNAT family N-acetyltransferase [bacterium]
MYITCEPAQKEESPRIAELINIASYGLVEFMFHDLVPGLTPVQLVAFSLAEDKNHHTYRNAVVARSNGTIAGMIFAYSSEFKGLDEETRSLVPQERLDHIMEVFTKTVPGSLYIDALCVDEQYRGRGIGTALLSSARDRARDEGYNSLSLIVMAHNERALSVYKKFGFKTVDTVAVKPHELIPQEGGAYLVRYIL